MALIVSAAGSNAWNTNGAWVGSVQPTSADQVTITAGTTVNIPTGTTVSARSVTVAATAVLKWDSTSATLAIGDGTADTGNVAFSNAGTLTLTGIGVINFIWSGSAPGSPQTITTGGQTMPQMTIGSSGAGSANGSWQLQDNYTFTGGSITLTAGTFDTNNKTLNGSSFASNNSNTRTLTMGSSSITTNNNNNGWLFSNTSGLTVTANTASVTGASAAPTVNFGTANWNGMSYTLNGVTSGASISGACTLATLTITGTASKVTTYTYNNSFTCTTSFVVNGNTATNRVLFGSGVFGSTTTITAAAVTLTNVDFKDITGAGAATWSGTSIGDCGGNSNITFTTPVTRYAVVAGNVSSTATWSATSGGAGGQSVPLPQDTVNFGGGSAAGTYTNDMPRWGTNIDFTQNGGFTRTFALNLNMETYGSWTFNSSASMTLSGNSGIQIGGRGSYTFTSAGNTIGTSGFVLQAPGGTMTMQDAFNSTGPTIHTDGTLNTNGFSYTTTTLTSSGTRTRVLTLGTSTINLTSTATTTIWSLVTGGGTYNCASSTIVVSNTSANTRTFGGGSVNYGTLTYTVTGSTGQLTMSSAQFVDTFNFSDSTNARTVALTSGNTFAFRVFNVFGTSGKVMTVKGVTGASATFIELMGAVNTGMDFLTLQDVVSSIPGKFFAGANSTIVSNVVGVDLTAAPTPGPYIDWLATGTASGASVTLTLPAYITPTNGRTFHLLYGATSSAGTINTPSGWSTDVANGTQIRQFKKVSDGTETGVTVTTTSAPGIANLHMMQLGGFSGTPTFDVSDTNTTAGATSLNSTATTGPTNTGTPALALAHYQSTLSISSSVSATNSFEFGRDYQTTTRTLAKTLTTTAAVSTTYTWTTSRSVSSLLVVYKDVVAGGTAKSGTLLLLGVG